jgi:mRNA-degrading endonuclease toxin of MazEF toxin-antitoxin module
MNLRAGELLLIRMPFHQAAGVNVRPAVVLLDSGDEDFIAAPVTSQPRRSAFDVELKDWRSAGLNVASYVRVHKLTVLAKTDIARKLGSLSPSDYRLINQVTCMASCPPIE